jgi:hypothetical protein
MKMKAALKLEERIVDLTSQLLDLACDFGSIRESFEDDEDMRSAEFIEGIESTLLSLFDELDDVIVVPEEAA